MGSAYEYGVLVGRLQDLEQTCCETEMQLERSSSKQGLMQMAVAEVTTE